MSLFNLADLFSPRIWSSFWWRIPIPKTIIANAGASNWRCLGGVGTGGSEVRDNKQTAIYVK